MFFPWFSYGFSDDYHGFPMIFQPFSQSSSTGNGGKPPGRRLRGCPGPPGQQSAAAGGLAARLYHGAEGSGTERKSLWKMGQSQENHSWLVVWNVFSFPYIGNNME